MNISGPAAVAKPEMLFYAPGDLTVTKNGNIRVACIGFENQTASDPDMPL